MTGQPKSSIGEQSQVDGGEGATGFCVSFPGMVYIGHSKAKATFRPKKETRKAQRLSSSVSMELVPCEE